IHLLDVLEGADALVHEALVDLARVQVGVGAPGEPERRLRRLCHLDGAEEGEPTGRRGSAQSREHRLVQEDAAADSHRPAGAPLQLLAHCQTFLPIVVHCLASSLEMVGCRAPGRHAHFFFSSTSTCATFPASTFTGTSASPAYSCQATSVYEPGGTSGRLNSPLRAVTA